MSAGSASSSRVALAWLAMLLPAIGLRVLLLSESGAAISLGDLRGALADASVAGFAVVGVTTLARLGGPGRVAAVLVAALWGLAHYVNYEVVRALGSLASIDDIGFLGDATFVGGSVRGLAHPVWLAACVAIAAFGSWSARTLSVRTILASAAVAAVFGIVQASWSLTDEVALWRQADFVSHNARHLAQSSGRETRSTARFSDAATAMLDGMPELGADLSGEPRLSLPGSSRNVLLVVLESISGGYLDSLAADHGRRSGFQMARVDAVARSNLAYSTFFAHQRKTNRGLYALLCGELPNLGSGLPKMSAFGDGAHRVCLPEVLGEAGFETAYLQAAPLAFMLKDQFMPRAGFAQVHGDEWFQRHYERSVWGVDDRAFFEQSLEKIAELGRGESPWFLTLLTVGTHYPFVLPDDFHPEWSSRFKRALAYLDDAVAEFVHQLEQRGVLEDTLVLITSDESLGFPGPGGVVSRALSENWGLLVAMLPEKNAGNVTETFSQSDLALSVLDYLDLADRGGHFFGRSVFREYAGRRFVFFANSNHRFNAALDPLGRLLLCFDDFRSCRVEQPEGGQVFSGERRTTPWSEAEGGILRDIASRSVHTPAGDPERRDFALLSASHVVIDTGRLEIVHGGQYVDVSPGQWLEVDFEVEARGDGELVLSQVLVPDKQSELGEWETTLGDGQRLLLQYTFAPSEETRAVEVRSYARSVSGEPVELVVERARMSLRWAGDHPEPGVRVRTFEVSPPSGN